MEQGSVYLPPATEANSDSEAERELDDEERRTTQEEVDEELDMMKREAEMGIDQLRAMYARMQEEAGVRELKEEETPARSNGLDKLIMPEGEDDEDENGDDDTEDEDYKPPPPLPVKYKEPRIGLDYQVDPSSIPRYASIETCDDNPDDFASRLWAPNSDTEVERFLTEHRKRSKIRQPTNEKVANKKTLPDSEEALEQLLACNYNIIQTHKRIKARSRLTPKNRGHWTQEEMALFELGLTTKGKNFFKIHHEHLPNKTIKEIVLFYYKWKKTKRADSYGAKTRNSKRKFENCTNYMDKLLDDIEQKRSRKGDKSKRSNNSDAGVENSVPETKPAEPIVMTLDLSSNGKWRLNSSTD